MGLTAVSVVITETVRVAPFMGPTAVLRLGVVGSTVEPSTDPMGASVPIRVMAPEGQFMGLTEASAHGMGTPTEAPSTARMGMSRHGAALLPAPRS